MRKLLQRMSAPRGENLETNRQALQTLFQEFEETQADVRMALSQIGDRISKLGLDQSIHQRHLKAVKAFEQGNKKLRAVIGDVIDGMPGALQRALDLMQQLKFREDPPLLNSGLPFQKLTFTITNTGPADPDASSIALGAGSSTDFAITSGAASILLAPGANTTVQVTYSPSDEGADSGTLLIDSDDSDDPTVTVSLYGNGVPVPGPEIDVNPLSLNYGDVFIGSDSVLSVAITNTGPADLDVYSIAEYCTWCRCHGGSRLQSAG